MEKAPIAKIVEVHNGEHTVTKHDDFGYLADDMYTCYNRKCQYDNYDYSVNANTFVKDKEGNYIFEGDILMPLADQEVIKQPMYVVRDENGFHTKMYVGGNPELSITAHKWLVGENVVVAGHINTDEILLRQVETKVVK